MTDVAVSIAPVAVLVAMLVLVKASALVSAATAFASGAALALAFRGLPLRDVGICAAKGAATGLFPIGLVVVAALFTYALTVESGAIDDIKKTLSSLSGDRRYLALVVVWGFGNFMEGMAGFGTAVAIPCAILVGLGFDPLRAVLCCLVANTTPTAYGSVGVPTMVLAGETALDVAGLSADIARLQLAVTALSPFLLLFIADGLRGVREKWALALVADVAFLVPWFAVASTLGCELPNIAGGLSVMAVLALLGDFRKIDARRTVWAWSPFVCVVAVLAVAAALPAKWKVSPGLLVLAAGFAGGLVQRVRPARQAAILGATLRRYSPAVATICLVLALAKVMGASGMTSTLAGALVAASGGCYAAFSPVVGSLGGFVTGSGTSSNVLFGALQASVGATAAEKALFAAANVMGAGIGKMVCPQSIVLGCAAAGLAGRESEVLKRAAAFFVGVLAAACLATVAAAALAAAG